MKTSVAFLLLFSLLTASLPAKPNVIFILCDDMGWGDIGVFYQNSRGTNPKFSTPNLDTLAAEGTQLRRHYSASPVCAPARASLLLGVHQGHSNVRDNQFDKELADNHTLGTVMKQAGYATACIGKWGLQGSGTAVNQPSHPNRRGFDYFFGYLAHLTGHYHYPDQFSGNDNQGQPIALHENTTTVTSQFSKCYSTDLFTARAKKWIADQHTASPTRPFFLYLALPAPHARLDVPTQAYPAGKGISGGLQWNGTSGAMINTASGTINSWIHPDYAGLSWPDYAKRYATMVRRIDDAVSDLVQTLKDLDIDDNTLIVFTSDNGPANEAGNGGSYTYNPTYFRSYAHMDGLKRDMWEGGIRVPAIVRWPASIPAGGIDNAPSQFQDWLPTLADLAGIPAPARTDGVSLLPSLTGTGTRRPSTIYSEYLNGGSTTTPSYPDFESAHITTRGLMQMVHIGDFKGVRYNTASHATDFRIYNVAADPKETTDLSGQPGAPAQQDFKDKALRVRRTGGGVTRSYDAEPVPALPPRPVVNGLDFHAYEKPAPWVPDWETENAAASGQAAAPAPSARTRDHDIGLLFTGYLQIPANGSYTFYLSTDTGAFVRLHDAQLIDADAGYAPGSEKSSGAIPLAAGLHPIRIHYRHADAASHLLDLQWSGPGIAKQPVPAAAWFRDGEPVPVPPVANPDNASTTGAPAVSVWIDALANDFDDDTPEPLSITEISTPEHGAAIAEEGGIRYTPHENFLGTDSFDYTISDGAETSTATVTVEVLPATATLWLPLDETGGEIAHDALGRPAGTLANFPENPWAAGKLGNALTFDGSDDRVNLTGRKGITGTAARTVSFWLNAAAAQTAGTRPTIVSWGNNNGTAAGTRFDINLNHTNGYRLRAEFNAAGANFTTAARSDLRGAGWVHCAIVMPAGATVSQLRAYLDGELATAAIEPANSGGIAINTSSVNDITLGRMADGSGGRALAGLLDDVRIYDRALSAEEIAALASLPPANKLRDQWFFRHTGNDLPSPADWLADADGDGFSILLEYALGGNPTVPSSGISPVLEKQDGLWNFLFPRRKYGLASASYIVETSETLASESWETVDDLSLLGETPSGDFQEIKATLPESSTGRRFVRLRVAP